MSRDDGDRGEAMKALEEAVYDAVKNYPWLKNAIRTAYQATLLPWLGRRHTCAYPMTSRVGYFFGFHDKTPWGPDDRRVLAHRLVGEFEPDRSGVEVGFFTDSSLSRYVPVDATRAWSKQQGAQLQWRGERGEIVYNVRSEDGTPGAVIRRLGEESRKELAHSVGAVDDAGRFACVVDYGAFGVAKVGYGYGRWARKAFARRDASDPGRGLTELVLETGEIAPRRTLPELIETVSAETNWDRRSEWLHLLSHPSYSPGGAKLAFFLRRCPPGRRMQTKVCVYDRNNDRITVMQTGDMASHYCWLGDDRLLAYLQIPDGRECFRVVSVSRGVSVDASGLQGRDGHPAYSPESGLLVVDSYADRRRRQALNVYRRVGDIRFENTVSAKFYTPLRFRNEDRVDLHPRWDRQGSRICVDSSFRGERALTVVRLE